MPHGRNVKEFKKMDVKQALLDRSNRACRVFVDDRLLRRRATTHDHGLGLGLNLRLGLIHRVEL